ncbi:outer membrane lipid asymmetry maintenance protein MlaD [Marinobacterium jannaschii]|uniref:outer membrane lipid asymmetry maintenance protein MlaD n=1 Tax=Marinobacterium jannaschii TaxID=64970 RepID=UPI000483EA0D|nr:outer membrane lipid asymmetry maintenance protein MlaD [Marinobacterium jannaschii]
MRLRIMEISVGAFLLIGILALMTLALNVSGLNLAESKSTYKIYARFENIGGLTPRAKVTMAGVVIGQVSSITLDKERFVAVVGMDIHDDVDYLSSDSSVAILTAGLLGEQYIGVTVGADEEVMSAGDFFEDTQSALVLEELISKFLFNEVGG